MPIPTPLAVYNTLTKKEEEFVSIDEERRKTLRQAQGENGSRGTVLMYTCGPTVYGRPHIGNYSSFLMADLLRRWLLVKGYEVTHVQNITDVGHLVADADRGEDKIQRQAEQEAAARRGRGAQAAAAADVLAIARKYTEQFLEDERLLNILEPQERPRATETVKEMIAIIRTLTEQEQTYETSDGIYFDVRTFPEYGKLSGNTLENLEAGARVSVNEEKRHPADFALWKKCVGENARHLLRWTFPGGERVSTTGEDPAAGFPGWHIECSAMSRKFLGEQIDVHTGGEDNIFPHHECEIAQSESSGRKPFSRYWLHKRRIDMGDAKMSKSLGNVLTVPDVVAKGFDPLDLRYYFLSVHYRTPLKFTWKGLEDARKVRLKIVEWMEERAAFPVAGEKGGASVKETEQWRAQFAAALDADLNTSAALAAVFECMTWSRKQKFSAASKEALASFIDMVRRTFGCFEPASVSVPDDVLALARLRDEARARKDFAASDRLRDELQSLGYEVRDTPKGTEVRRR